MLLPPYKQCTMGYLKDILTCKKKVLQNHEANAVNFPRLKPVSVKVVLHQAL